VAFVINNFSKIILILLGLFFLNITIYSQENQGLIFDNYSPVTGQFINPSNIVDSKTWLDINLIGASAFVYNNYFFYPNTTLFNFDSFNSEPLFKSNISEIKAYENALIPGPAASLIFGRQSASIFSNLRIVANGDNVSTILARMPTEDGLNESDTGFYDISNARVKLMAWGEIGITYGGILRARETTMITGAVSLKRLFGFQNSTVIIEEGLLYVVNADSVAIISNTGKYSYADPATNAGRGWGMNIGATYKKMKENVSHYIPHSTFSHCNIIDYKYKVGVSLIDIGYIKFKNNAYFGNLEDITIIDTIDNGNDVLDEAKRLATGNKYTAPLPMAASVQFDYNLNDLFYINGTIIQRFPTKKTLGPERANLLAISPRYESKYVGVSIPVSLVNYNKVYMGLAFRLYFLSIGTDNIVPWFIKQDINMASFYINLKIPLYTSPKCRTKKNKEKSDEYIINACPTWEKIK
jgi:hypothetical protein